MSDDPTSSIIIKGLLAGLVATLALTFFMMMKKIMGVMPELDPVHMMSEMIAQKMGTAPSTMIGWVMHFFIGSVVWGGAFAVLNNRLPGKNQISKGINLGIGAWLVMMIGPMPLSGAGLFGLQLGFMAPAMTLVLHIIFGFFLGIVFKKLVSA